MVSKLIQTQKISQKFLSQQILVSKLLEVSNEKIEEVIEKELEKNPTLELDESENKIENLAENDLNYTIYKKEKNSEIYDNAIETHSSQKNIYDELFEQLNFLKLSERDFFLAEYVILTLEPNGFLKISAENICSKLLYEENFDAKTFEVQKAINLIRSMNPIGVGLSSIKEYIELQIKNLDLKNIEVKKRCLEILSFLPKDLENSKKNILLKLSKLDDETYKEAKKIIRLLKTAPYEENFDIEKNNDIHVDFIITNENNKLVAKLNKKNIPIRINSFYKNYSKITKEEKSKKCLNEVNTFLEKKIFAAEAFIRAINQRETTFKKVIDSILFFQKDFFLRQEKKFIKPLTLKNISEKSGLDISTVSRVVNSKYVQTDFGIFSLKDFFSSFINSKNGEVSSIVMKAKIQKIVDNENKNSPLSDLAISKILKNKGYNIARRTITKYREALNIPISAVRKKK